MITINAAALTAVCHRGTFAGSDAFVAFFGLDVRLRESGKFKGQSKLVRHDAVQKYEAFIRLDLGLASRRMNISLAKCIYP